MERFLRGRLAGRPRSDGIVRGRGRGRGRVIVEVEEVASNASSDRDDSEDDDETDSTRTVDEIGDHPDSAFIGGEPVEKALRAAWFPNFYEPLLWPAKELKIAPTSVVARCKLCMSEQKKRSFYSTDYDSLTNLRRHVKRKHEPEWEEWVKTKKKTIRAPPPGQATLPFAVKTMGKARQEELKAALATMIVIDNMPVTSVLKPGFRHYTAVATKVEGNFPIPCYETLHETLIPAKKKKTRDAIDGALQTIKTLCAHIDIWSSKSMHGYLGISVSGITTDFSCFKAYLACKHMTGSHTGVAILRVYEEVVQSWGLQDKIKRVVTDNASNMLRAFNIGFPNWENEKSPVVQTDSNNSDLLFDSGNGANGSSLADTFSLRITPEECEITRDALEDEDFQLIERELDGKFDTERVLTPVSRESNPPTTFQPKAPMRTSCCAHTLQLVITDGFKNDKSWTGEITETVRRVSKVVSSIKASLIDTEILLKCVGFKLSLANATRWNSQLKMMTDLLRALEKDPTIQDQLSAFKTHGMFLTYELKIIKELVMILQPFLEATDEWQRDFQSVGTVIPAYLHMRNTLVTFSKPGSGVVRCKAFAQDLLESLDRRFNYVLSDTYYLLGALFDPRYKLGWIHSSGLSESAVLEALKLEIKTHRTIQCIIVMGVMGRMSVRCI